MARITEPLLACPNDPDDVRPLSEVAGRPVDEVFIGSCMTNLATSARPAGCWPARIGGVPARLWIAPPTRTVEARLRQEGYYSTYGAAGARTEIPGCSLCMGNQATVAQGPPWCRRPPATSPTAWATTPRCFWPRPRWPRLRRYWAESRLSRSISPASPDC